MGGLPRENSPSPRPAGLGSKDGPMKVSALSALTSWFLFYHCLLPRGWGPCSGRAAWAFLGGLGRCPLATGC